MVGTQPTPYTIIRVTTATLRTVVMVEHQGAHTGSRGGGPQPSTSTARSVGGVLGCGEHQ